MKIPFVAALALLAAAPGAPAEPDSGHIHDSSLVFDRRSAIERAIASNKDLAAARLAIARAEARLDASGIAPNPSLEIEYEDDFAFRGEGERSLALGVSQRFPLARRLAKEKAVSRVDIAKAKMEVRRHERQLAATIAEFALDIQLIDTRLEWLRAERETLAESAAFAAEKARVGEVSPLDAGEIDLDLRALQQAIGRIELDRERLIHRIAPQLGLASAEHIAFRPDTRLPYEGKSLPSFDPAVLERDPDFQLAVLEERAAEAEIALAEAANWEAITASLFWRSERAVDEPVGRESDELVGVSLSVPLPIRRKGDLLAREQRARREQTRLESAAIRFRIQNDIEHARHEATILKRRMDAFDAEALQVAEAQSERALEAFGAGQVELYAALRAQERRRSLRESYLDLRDEYARALLELELARNDIPTSK